MKTPTLPNSNIPNPLYPASKIIPSTTKLVEVPISVHIPPNMVAYEIGIKNLVAGIQTDSAHRLTIGAKITTTGVLFKKAETKEITGSIRACAFMTVVFS